MSRVLEYITEQLKQRQEEGLEKYGVSIDECGPPTGSFRMEVIQEVLDALQYMTRIVFQREAEIKLLADAIERVTSNCSSADDYFDQLADVQKAHAEMRKQYEVNS